MPNDTLLKELLTMKLKQMKPGNAKKFKSPTKNLSWLFPFGLERQMTSTISKIMKELTAFGEEGLMDALQGWIDEKALLSGKIDQSRADGFSAEIKLFVSSLLAKASGITSGPGGENTRLLLNTMAISGSDQNLRQWKKFTKSLVGLEVVLDEPWEAEALENWGENSLNLIGGLTSEYAKRYSFIINNGIRFGETASSMAIKIKALGNDMTKRRAALIARDQVASLHGELTKARQTDAGIALYIWQTVGDERVRGKPGGRYPNAVPSHHLMSGTVNKWSDNTVYSNDQGVTWKKRVGKMPIAIPGQEILCRCSALAFFDDLIEEVKANIENDKNFVLPGREKEK